MIRGLFLVIVGLLELNASADSPMIRADLVKVDAFGCNIEDHGANQIRILSTEQNTTPNRYLDVSLDDKDMTFETLEDGWKLSKTVDLHKQAIAPLAPKWLFGNAVTTLIFKTDDKGESTLSVDYIASTMAFPRAGAKFKCSGAKNIVLDKKVVCPTCLSSK